MHLLARFLRWCHTMRWMFHGHLGVTIYARGGRVIVLGCTCGKSFWVDESALDRLAIDP